MIIRDAIAWGTSELEHYSPSPRLDAELLVAACVSTNRLGLFSRYLDSVSDDQRVHLEQMVARRKAREPIAYILGEREFWGLAFEVSSAVLIPRPESELLVEQGVALLVSSEEGNEQSPAILDLGTGSGCLVVSLVHELRARGRKVAAVAIDQSLEALAVAQRNAIRHGVENLIRFVHSSWCEELISTDTFNLIVSNPPYIADGDVDVSPELVHEPHSALYAGVDGLDDVRILLRQAPQHLSPSGSFLFEYGATQRAAIDELARSILDPATFEWQFHKDYAGCDRLISIARRT